MCPIFVQACLVFCCMSTTTVSGRDERAQKVKTTPKRQKVEIALDPIVFFSGVLVILIVDFLAFSDLPFFCRVSKNWNALPWQCWRNFATRFLGESTMTQLYEKMKDGTKYYRGLFRSHYDARHRNCLPLYIPAPPRGLPARLLPTSLSEFVFTLDIQHEASTLRYVVEADFDDKSGDLVLAFEGMSTIGKDFGDDLEFAPTARTKWKFRLFCSTWDQRRTNLIFNSHEYDGDLCDDTTLAIECFPFNESSHAVRKLESWMMIKFAVSQTPEHDKEIIDMRFHVEKEMLHIEDDDSVVERSHFVTICDHISTGLLPRIQSRPARP
jgi:hypothetical protein